MSTWATDMDKTLKFSDEYIARNIVDRVRSSEKYAQMLIPTDKIMQGFAHFITLSRCLNQGPPGNADNADFSQLDVSVISPGSCRWIAESFMNNFVLYSHGKIPFISKTLGKLLGAMLAAVKWGYWKKVTSQTIIRRNGAHDNVLPGWDGNKNMEESFNEIKDKLVEEKFGEQNIRAFSEMRENFLYYNLQNSNFSSTKILILYLRLPRLKNW